MAITFETTRSHGTEVAIIISSYETPCAFRMGRITLPSAPQHLKGERRQVKWEIGLAGEGISSGSPAWPASGGDSYIAYRRLWPAQRAGGVAFDADLAKAGREP